MNNAPTEPAKLTRIEEAALWGGEGGEGWSVTGAGAGVWSEGGDGGEAVFCWGGAAPGDGTCCWEGAGDGATDSVVYWEGEGEGLVWLVYVFLLFLSARTITTSFSFFRQLFLFPLMK